MFPLPLSFLVQTAGYSLVLPRTTHRVLAAVMRCVRPMETRGSKFHLGPHTLRHPIKAALNRLRSPVEVLIYLETKVRLLGSTVRLTFNHQPSHSLQTLVRRLV